MHAPGHRWTTLILVVTVALIMGCRGSHPFNRFVQVTQEPDTDFPEIEPPRQRLATAKTRTQSDSPPARPPRADDSPHVARTASSKSSAAPRTDTASRTGTASRTAAAQRSVADRRSSAPKTTPRTDSSAPATTTEGQKLAEKSAPSKKTETADELDPARMMDAFSDYPPEVQREALRRLVAATSRSADRTMQPNSLDSELAKNVLSLPKLPDAKNSTPEVPPTRIASEASSKSSTGNLVATEQKDKVTGGETVAQGRVTDLETSELEPAVQSISDSVVNDKSVVKAASGSRSDSDESMIARASIEPNLLEKKSDDATTEAPSDQLSDKKLYAALLKRLSTAAPGESEADRSGRLIKLRHLMVLSGDPDAAVKQIEGLAEAEQEYLRHQLLGLWTMIDPQGHPVPSRRFTTALPQIREAAKFAAAATDSLDVRSLAFCTEIESYGQIKTFSGNRFEAGQQVILYCEIENFTVNKTEQGFETNLQGSYDIYNADNEKVVSQLLPADNQVSANYLRDYFIAYQMHLPQQLSGGTYRLQLTMEDVSGKKYGQASIPFEIAK